MKHFRTEIASPALRCSKHVVFRRLSRTQVCELICLPFFTEEEKAIREEFEAWEFFDTTFRSPLDDDWPLPLALTAHQAAYDDLNAQQKTHLSGTLIPLLIERKDELAASDDKNESFSVYKASTWMRILLALSRFDSSRHPQPNDCLFSTHKQRKIVTSDHIYQCKGLSAQKRLKRNI